MPVALRDEQASIRGDRHVHRAIQLPLHGESAISEAPGSTRSGPATGTPAGIEIDPPNHVLASVCDEEMPQAIECKASRLHERDVATTRTLPRLAGSESPTSQNRHDPALRVDAPHESVCRLAEEDEAGEIVGDNSSRPHERRNDGGVRAQPCGCEAIAIYLPDPVVRGVRDQYLTSTHRHTAWLIERSKQGGPAITRESRPPCPHQETDGDEMGGFT